MITLLKGQQNNVVVTLFESSTIEEPFFVFEFKHKFTGEIRVCAAPDISTSVGRYNEFLLTPDDGDELDGYAELKPGFHSYRCLQASVLSTTPDSPEIEVESGICLVVDPSAPQAHKLENYSGKEVKQWDGN